MDNKIIALTCGLDYIMFYRMNGTRLLSFEIKIEDMSSDIICDIISNTIDNPKGMLDKFIEYLKHYNIWTQEFELLIKLHE